MNVSRGWSFFFVIKKVMQVSRKFTHTSGTYEQVLRKKIFARLTHPGIQSQPVFQNRPEKKQIRGKLTTLFAQENEFEFPKRIAEIARRGHRYQLTFSSVSLVGFRSVSTAAGTLKYVYHSKIHEQTKKSDSQTVFYGATAAKRWQATTTPIILAARSLLNMPRSFLPAGLDK